MEKILQIISIINSCLTCFNIYKFFKKNNNLDHYTSLIDV